MIEIGGRKYSNVEQWQVDYIKEHWHDQNNTAISEAVGIERKRVSSIGMSLGLPKREAHGLIDGVECILVNGKYFKNFTYEQLDYIKEHWQEGPSAIGKALGKDARRVSDIILRLDLRDSLTKQIDENDEFEDLLLDLDLTSKQIGDMYGVTASAIAMKRRQRGIVVNHIKLPRTPEVDAELSNPYLSHEELARKYRVSAACIARRREKLGVGVRRKNFNTVPELIVAEIFDELDIVYDQQRRIDKWSIDFYLGQRRCVEVNGTWQHSKPITQRRDSEKRQYLESKGYQLLAIEEAELDNLPEVKQRIAKFVGVPLLERAC